MLISNVAKLMLLTLFVSGCASNTLTKWNDTYAARNQRSIEFANNSVVKADYLGKQENDYVYRAKDSHNRVVFFRLPAKNGKDQFVRLQLENRDGSKVTADFALFHFNGDYWRELEIDTISDFPKNVNVYTSGFSYETKYQYSCKEGSFRTGVPQGVIPDTKLGLSTGVSLILGLRNLGYIVTVPIDIATLPFQVFYRMTSYHPFGGP
jgi:hypothetical protein